MRILFLGDVVGKVGRQAVKAVLPDLILSHEPDFTIINAENSAAGFGITPDIAEELIKLGADGITLGNHAFHRQEIEAYLESSSKIVRPANYPPGVPGRGWTVLKKNSLRLGLANLCGRVFMGDYDDPFRTMEAILRESETRCWFVDFHAEATSEKMAFAWHFDGRVSAIVGTHTHVQTSDERILPGGTAFLTDVGMCGPKDSVIGMDRDIVLRRFLTQMPHRFEVARSPGVICGVVIDVNAEDGRAESIERIQIRDIG